MTRPTRKVKIRKRTARVPKRKPPRSKPRVSTKAPAISRLTGTRKRRVVLKKRPAKGRGSPPKRRKLRSDPRAEAAVLEMNRGRSLTAAAKEMQLSREQLKDYLAQRRLLKPRKKGRRWIAKDNRLRRVPVMTGGRVVKPTVRGYEQARLVGEHHHAVGQFVATNNLDFIKPFEGRSVTTANGRQYLLETDPNALHRIAAMDTPPFHEIYEITSSS